MKKVKRYIIQNWFWMMAGLIFTSANDGIGGNSDNEVH